MSRRLAALLAALNDQQADGLARLLADVRDTQPGRNDASRRVCEALWALPARRTP